jgi:hypothetical protein
LIFEFLSSIYSVTIDKYIHNNNKDGDLKMFRELRDLIIEGLHLLLLYGFLSIYAIGVVIIFISKTPQNNPQHLYYSAKPPEPVIQKESSEESLRVVERKRICNWIEGCATFTNAKTQKNIALLVSGF